MLLDTNLPRFLPISFLVARQWSFQLCWFRASGAPKCWVGALLNPALMACGSPPWVPWPKVGEVPPSTFGSCNMHGPAERPIWPFAQGIRQVAAVVVVVVVVVLVLVLVLVFFVFVVVVILFLFRLVLSRANPVDCWGPRSQFRKREKPSRIDKREFECPYSGCGHSDNVKGS